MTVFFFFFLVPRGTYRNSAGIEPTTGALYVAAENTRAFFLKVVKTCLSHVPMCSNGRRVFKDKHGSMWLLRGWCSHVSGGETRHVVSPHG